MERTAVQARPVSPHAGTAADAHHEAVLAEQVRLLYAQLASALIGTTIVGALVVLVLWRHVPQGWLLAWAGALALMSLARVALRRAYFRRAPAAGDALPWARRFLAGVLASGMVWGAAGMLPIRDGARLEEMFLLFVLAGLAAGGMSTLSCYRGAYAAFLLPAIVPFGVKLLTRGDDMHIAMGVMLIVFVVLMSMISVRHYRSVVDSLRLRHANRDLLTDLTIAHAQQQDINKELEGQIHERQRIGEALRLAYDELELKVRERTGQLAHANEVLNREKELFRVTLASIGDAVITTDAWARVTSLNAAAERMTGWQNALAQGRPLAEIFRASEEGATQAPAEELALRCLSGNASVLVNRCMLTARDARRIHIDMSVAAIRDGRDASIGVVLVLRDATQERQLTQQLAHQATHDALTGLVNRTEFERRLTALIPSSSLHAPHALLYLDLDQFKVVNDTCGHAAGDDLLRQVAALMRTKLRAQDTLATSSACCSPTARPARRGASPTRCANCCRASASRMPTGPSPSA